MKHLTPEKAQKDTISKGALAQLFARARLSEHYWLEAIDLCETKKQRRALAREIAELAKAAAANNPAQERADARTKVS